ncbi:MAG: hypothetical protein ACKPHU_24440 [Planctomycetaceae bacterium]
MKNPDSGIRAKLASISPQQVVTCSVVLSELLHGAEIDGSGLDPGPDRASRRPWHSQLPDFPQVATDPG